MLALTFQQTTFHKIVRTSNLFDLPRRVSGKKLSPRTLNGDHIFRIILEFEDKYAQHFEAIKRLTEPKMLKMRQCQRLRRDQGPGAPSEQRCELLNDLVLTADSGELGKRNCS